MSEEISEPSTNIFADLDLPHYAKARFVAQEWAQDTQILPVGTHLRPLISAIAAALEDAVKEEREQIHSDLIMQAKGLAERASSGSSVRAELLSVAGFMEDFANDYRSDIRSRTQKETPDA
jgi:hypothetical protein